MQSPLSSALRQLIAALLLSACLIPAASAAQPDATVQIIDPNFYYRQIALPFFTTEGAAGQPAASANVQISLASDPAMYVPRGREMTWVIRAENTGAATSATTRVFIPYRADQLSADDSDASHDRGDWIASISASWVTAEFGALSPGERRAIYLYMFVRAAVPYGTVIESRAEYDCPTHDCRTNRLSFQVINNDSGGGEGANIDFAVAPDRGLPGTDFQFSTDQFRPGERVTTWLVTPSGTAATDQSAVANGNGQVWFGIESASFAPGDYALVGKGALSGVTAVGAFRVQGPGGAPPLTASRPRSNAPASAADGAPGLSGDLGGMTGRVTASDSGAGLPGVLVTANDLATGLIVASATTDSSGFYAVFSGLASASYRVRFTTANALAASTRGYAAGALASVLADGTDVTRSVNIALSPGGAISGRLTAQDTGGTIADVPVAVIDSAGATVAVVRSAADGTFSAPGLPTGSYNVRVVTAAAPSAFGRLYGGYAGSGPTIAVTAPSTTALPAIPLLRTAIGGGTISGTITADDGGPPLGDVYVAVRDSNGALATLVTTDPSGVYQTGEVAVGSYSLSFVTDFASSPRTLAYINEGASSVAVTAGAQTLVSASLARGSQITGKVTAADGGAPLKDVSVVIYNTSGTIEAFTFTGATGVYTTTGLNLGTYRVRFVTAVSADPVSQQYIGSFYSGAASLDLATPVQIFDTSAVPLVNAALTRGAALGGSVTGSGGVPLDGVLVGLSTAAGSFVTFTTTAAGRYRFGGLATGSYKVGFFPGQAREPATRRYSTTWYSGAATLESATPIALSAPASQLSVNQSLTQLGQIAGKVTGVEGIALAGVRVIVYQSGAVITTATTDAAGTYATSALAAGSYKVQFDPSSSPVAFVRSYAAEYYDNATSQTDATPLAVVAGATKTATLALTID